MRKNLSTAERQLLAELNSVDNFDEFDNIEYAGGQINARNTGTGLSKIKGNPSFVGQFDIQVKIFYVKQTTAPDYTVVAASALPAGLQTRLPMFLFGYADFQGGYPNAISQLPTLGWSFTRYFTKGGEGGDPVSTTAGDPALPNNYSLVSSNFSTGDIIFTYSGVNGTDKYCAYVQVTCSSLAYATLLNATGSDRMVIDVIRYTVNDSAKIDQFGNQFNIIKQSFLGSKNNQTISPNSYKTPQQFQNNFIDIGIIQGIDKTITLATYINYDCVSINFAFFVKATATIKA